MFSSPQQSGVAEKESRDVIFHNSRESSNDSDMEVYETLTQRSKGRMPRILQVISLRNLFKGFKDALVGAMSLIQTPPLMRRKLNNKFGRMAYGK